jgi:hypothetical protein
MRKLFAFFNGVREFRTDWTLHYEGDLGHWYDRGRELAHQMTFRRFE